MRIHRLTAAACILALALVAAVLVALASVEVKSDAPLDCCRREGALAEGLERTASAIREARYSGDDRKVRDVLESAERSAYSALVAAEYSCEWTQDKARTESYPEPTRLRCRRQNGR